MRDKITFSELVKSFAELHDITQQKAEKLVRGLFNFVIDDLEKDGKASITNFGSFEIKQVAERTGLNPQTKEEIIIPAHNKVTFKPFKALEKTVNTPFADLEPKLIGDSPKKDEPESNAKESKEDFEDPFESVINPTAENEETTPEIIQDEEEELAEPPVYKATVNKQKKGSGMSWLLIVLLLFVVCAGAWFFFFRNTESAYSEYEVAGNEPAKIEQPSKKQEEPPISVPKKIQLTEATSAQKAEQSPANKNAATEKSKASTEKVAPKKSESMTSYIVKQDEWMWDISRSVYGKAYLWPLIFIANKTANDDPSLVAPMSTLMIPALEGSASELTKTDYAKLAKATKLVSAAYGNAGNTERSAEYLRFSKKYERQSKN